MPRPTKGPTLRLRRRTDRPGSPAYWIISDRGRIVATGYSEPQIADAEQALANYIAEKYRPDRIRDANNATVADALIPYLDDKVPDQARAREARQILSRLNAFFGHRLLTDIGSRACRDYAAMRKTRAGARNDLIVLRAAANHYVREMSLPFTPALAIPKPSMPRERHLTRSEAARLLLAAWRYRDGNGARSDQGRLIGRHIARVILLGLKTGTRVGALLSLRWMPSTDGGHIDVERGVLHRSALGERVASNKRKPPARLSESLQAHCRRWRAADTAAGISNVIHWRGQPVKKIDKAFRAITRAANLDAAVTAHVLRHTCATWLAERGVPPHEAAAYLGMSIEVYERRYLHHDPAFQTRAAEAL